MGVNILLEQPPLLSDMLVIATTANYLLGPYRMFWLRSTGFRTHSASQLAANGPAQTPPGGVNAVADRCSHTSVFAVSITSWTVVPSVGNVRSQGQHLLISGRTSACLTAAVLHKRGYISLATTERVFNGRYCRTMVNRLLQFIFDYVFPLWTLRNCIVLVAHNNSGDSVLYQRLLTWPLVAMTVFHIHYDFPAQ